MERCRREIAAIEGEIRSGNPDLQGLFLALSDWSAELRILQREVRAHEDWLPGVRPPIVYWFFDPDGIRQEYEATPHGAHPDDLGS